MSDLEAKVQHLLDIEEIKKLKYLYCRYNDGGWHGQPLSHQGPSHMLFTEDGVWDGSPIAKAEGRDEIRKLFDHFAQQPMAYHSVMNPIIEIEGDFARAHWHLVAGGRLPDDSSVLGIGGYEDEYVRTGEGWCIKLMKVIWGRAATLPEGWTQDDPNLM